MKLHERDKKIIWHPLTQEKTAAPVLAIKNAAGSYVYDEQGNAYLDLISSWWVNLHGHSHPAIALAIYDQAKRLEHVIFAGFTHEPAVKLCEKLQTILPPSLARFFFSDNGSTAVEVALKMAYQYWWNQGITEKKIFLSFDGGYHGDTFGAMSVGSTSGFHNNFSKLLFSVLAIPFPATWNDDQDIEKKECHALEILENHLTSAKNEIAALIVEPLIQGASGMRICRPEFLRKVVDRVRQENILIIFDEVMTGFGRTGTYFAMDQVDVIPDFICLSKGLSGGFLPLALTVTSEKIYQAFLSEHFSKAFPHSHSFTGNPLGCAAAIASLELLLKPETMNAIRDIHQAHQIGLANLANRCTNIKNIRSLGTIAAFDVISENPSLNQWLKIQFLKQGLLLRPLGNTVYLLPPYSTTASEIAKSYEKILSVISEISK